LSHPNLLPFFGMYYLDNRLCLISPWMENGHVMQFLKKNPGLAKQNRLSLRLDVAFGIRQLHQHKIVHGDLKAANILVTPSFKACIADFGLSAINIATLPVTQSTINSARGTIRYLAPELIRGDRDHVDMASDVYAFAYVCYEILTGNIPFPELKNDAAVMLRVLGGDRPRRLPACSGPPWLDSLWDLLQICSKFAGRKTRGSVQLRQRLWRDFKGPQFRQR
ncbi:kinase-like protein, partial [Mycena galopus ATCC 62051]